MSKNHKKRSSFSGKLGFVLSAAGASVGLGNIWRFPYLAAKYGGGIFLLIYILLALTFGYTMIVAETSIGRMTKKSLSYLWKIWLVFLWRLDQRSDPDPDRAVLLRDRRLGDPVSVRISDRTRRTACRGRQLFRLYFQRSSNRNLLYCLCLLYTVYHLCRCEKRHRACI